MLNDIFAGQLISNPSVGCFQSTGIVDPSSLTDLTPAISKRQDNAHDGSGLLSISIFYQRLDKPERRIRLSINLGP
jgi:hypothetical protein